MLKKHDEHLTKYLQNLKEVKLKYAYRVELPREFHGSTNKHLVFVAAVSFVA